MNGNIGDLLNMINSITEEEATAVAVLCKETALHRALVGDKTSTAQVTQTQRPREKRVSELLRELGVPTHIYGYKYLQAAIGAVMQEPNLLHGVTKELYPMVANQFETTSSRVERAIRHSIEVAWSRGNYALLKKVTPCVDEKSGKVPNSEFIAAVAEYLQSQD